MKRVILLIIVGAVLGGGGMWLKMWSGAKAGADEKAAADKPAGDEPSDETHITHDTNGNVVVNISDDTQGDAGIQVSSPAAAQFSPELKGYGRVQDPGPLAALVMELASARSAQVVSSNEFERLKILQSQGNASARALQAAEAVAQHDLLAIQSARDRLVLGWSAAIANRDDLPAFLQSLTSQSAALIRVDLPAAETLSAPPSGARITPLSGDSADVEFLGAAATVDPQTLGRGMFFLLKSNSLRLSPGEAVTAHLKLAGEPLTGVIIPRDAVVRTQGRGWVYMMNGGGEAYTRTAIGLDHPAEGGWFVANGLKADDHIVTTGAQTLLSEELKASLSGD